MKRILALLLALVLVLSMSSCGNSETKENQKEEGTEAVDIEMEEDSDETEAQIEADEDTDDEENAADVVDPQTTCMAVLGDALNIDAYDDIEVDEDSVGMYHIDWFEHRTELEYTMTLDDGTTVTLGSTLWNDLLDAGWSAQLPETADAHYYYINTCSKGDPFKGDPMFSVCVENPSDSAVPIAETVVTGITMEVKYGGIFDLSGITPSSTVADVVSVFGEPYHIYYSEYVGVELSYQDSMNSSLEITFDKSGAITSINYTYSL